MVNMCFDIRVIELYIHISIWTDFVIFRQLVLQKLVSFVISNFYHQLEQYKKNQLTHKSGIIRGNEISRQYQG